LLVEPPSKRPLRRRLGTLAVMTVLFACSAVLVRAGVRTPALNAALHDGIHASTERMLGFAHRIQDRRAALLAQRNQSSLPVKSAAPAAVAAPAQLRVATAGTPATSVSEALADATASAESDAEPNELSPAQANDASSAAENNDVTRVLAEAKALADKGRELRALELLRRAARQHGDDVAVLESLIKALQKNRSWGEALRFARRRVELDASSEARLDLARLERATGHRERALALLTPLADDASAGTQARELLRSLTGSEPVALRD
jgi:tetratricopeptide (TPR) repeat protein